MCAQLTEVCYDTAAGIRLARIRALDAAGAPHWEVMVRRTNTALSLYDRIWTLWSDSYFESVNLDACICSIPVPSSLWALAAEGASSLVSPAISPLPSRSWISYVLQKEKTGLLNNHFEGFAGVILQFYCLTLPKGTEHTDQTGRCSKKL